MAKNIQLDLETVENREMRLGSIISWDGKASELVELSRYEERALRHKGCPGAGKNGEGCRLCELNMPFNQQSMCANSIAACQAGNIRDFYDAPVCIGDHGYRSAAYLQRTLCCYRA